MDNAIAVDNLGNVGVNATTATLFQWFTPLAEWNITNLKWSVIATESIGFTAGTTFDITAPTGTNITSAITKVSSANIKLGGDSAVSPLIKGTEFNAAIAAFCATIVAAATAWASPDPTGAAAKTFAGAVSGACTALAAQLTNMTSTTSFTS